MAIVNVQGTFINAALKQSTFEGKTSYSVQLDVYQPLSTQNDKMVQIKVEDAQLLQQFQTNYAMGEPISIICSVNAYKNQAYYKFIDLVPVA